MKSASDASPVVSHPRIGLPASGMSYPRFLAPASHAMRMPTWLRRIIRSTALRLIVLPLISSCPAADGEAAKSRAYDILLKGDHSFWTEYPAIILAPGDKVTFDATGKIMWDPEVPSAMREVGPGGAGFTPSLVTMPEEFLLPDFPMVALIGKIGDTVFGIASRDEIKVTKPGRLNLGINERWLQGSWNDNQGEFHIRVTVVNANPRDPKPSDHQDPAAVVQELDTKVVELNARCEYQQAIEIAEKSLELQEAQGENNTAEFAKRLDKLGMRHLRVGAYEKAEPLFLQALKIRAKVFGGNAPENVQSLNNLAVLYRMMGAYEKAEPLFLQAKEIRANASRRGQSDYSHAARSLYDLAMLYCLMGELWKTEALLQQADEIQPKVMLGESQPGSAPTLQSLARLYSLAGAHEKAKSLYLRLHEDWAKRLGENDPRYAISLDDLAMVYKDMCEFQKAEPLLLQSSEIKAKALGRNEPRYASCLSQLADLYCLMGAYEKAEPLYLQADGIVAKVLGKEHPDFAKSLTSLAGLYHAMGAPDRAVPLVSDLTAIRRRLLSSAFGAFPEKDRTAYVQSLDPHGLPCSLENGPLAAESALAFKGAVCASVLEEKRILHAAAQPEAEALMSRLEALRRSFHRVTLQGNKQEGDWLFGQIEEVEKQLARFVTGLGAARQCLQTQTADVQHALPANAALVEILRYKRPVYDEQKKKHLESRYGAVVIRHDGEPVFVRLALAAEIDAAVGRFRALVEARSGQGGDAGCHAVARQLYQLLLAPLEAVIGDATTLVLSPDSQLHFLSFEPLLAADDRMACERWHIRMIDTGRDLLEKPATGPGNKFALLIGDPAFGAEGRASGGQGVQLADSRGIFVTQSNLKLGMQAEVSGMSFPSLPGTRAEVGMLDEMLRDAGWETQTLAESAASEGMLRNLIKGRKLVHLATHGYFLNQLEIAEAAPVDHLRPVVQPLPARAIQDPMLRSGLALAGANRTLAAWQKGEVPEPSNDGLLNAAEAVTLDLGGTELVVLSACETAAGKALDGEGIYGLRRALKLAGADTVVMTLWPVSDAYTAGFMKDLYLRYLGGQHPAVALAETKRDHLVKLRSEVGLQRAVQLVGPFTATGKGVAAVLTSEQGTSPPGAR